LGILVAVGGRNQGLQFSRFIDRRRHSHSAIISALLRLLNLLGGNLVSDAGGAEVLAYSEFPHGQLVLYLSFHLSQVIHLSLNRLSLGGPQEVVELEFLRGLRLDCLVDLLKGNALVPSFNVELPEVPRSLESLGFELRIRQFGTREDQAGPEPRGS